MYEYFKNNIEPLNKDLEQMLEDAMSERDWMIENGLWETEKLEAELGNNVSLQR